MDRIFKRERCTYSEELKNLTVQLYLKGKRKCQLKMLIIVLALTTFSGCTQKLPNASSMYVPVKTESSNATELNKDIPNATNNTVMEQIEDSIIECSIEEAWGDVPIIQKVYYDKPRLHFAISEDGELLSGEQSFGVETTDTLLLVNNIYTDETEIVKNIEYPIQISDATINDKWIVWTEISGDAMSADRCEIYGFNRETKESKLYFKTPLDSDGNPINPHIPVPELKGSAFLIDNISDNNQDEHLEIVSQEYNLDTGEFKEIAKQFAVPKWGDSGYIGLGEDLEHEGYSYIYSLNENVMTPITEKGTFIYDYSTDGEAVLFTAQDFKSVNPENEAQEKVLWLCEKGKKWLLKSPSDEDPDGCGWPMLSKRIAMWGFGVKPYAYDRLLNKIVILSDDKRGAAFYTNDKYMMWMSCAKEDRESGGQSMLNIIEIDKLPKE